MNFEEMLNAQEGMAPRREKLPFGDFYRKQIDGKYRFVVELKSSLTDSIVFCEALKKEEQWSLKHRAKQQLHFELHEDSSGVIYEMGLEPGNYQTLSQLFFDNPAVVAQKGFVDQIVGSLAEYASKLHSEGVYHLCFAPQNIFLRKGDLMPLLLCHGSFYSGLNDLDALYKDVEGFVAPEVLSHGTIDERSDVYSLGKFIDYLYTSSGRPFELKGVVKKATAVDPADRYASVEDLYSAMRHRHTLRRTSILGIAALAVALIVLGLFFEMLPNTEPVEFVKPVEEPIEESLLDEGFDPLTELGPDADSATIARAIQDYMMNDSDKVDAKKMREFEAKAEQIFRKQYTKAADAILSKIYNNERMNNNEKNFKAVSEEVMKELVEKQRELAVNSSLNDATAQRIASEIIDQLTEKKKAELEKKPNYGFQKGNNE